MQIPADMARLAASAEAAARAAAPAGLAGSPPATPAPGVGPSQPAGFGHLVRDALADVNRQQLEADAAVEALATGQADNVHQVVLTAIKADLSVRMLMEIRNQLVQSYQEVMRMQL